MECSCYSFLIDSPKMSCPIVGGQCWVEYPADMHRNYRALEYDNKSSAPGSTSWIDHEPGHLFDFDEFRERSWLSSVMIKKIS